MDPTPATPTDPVPTPLRGFGQCYLRGRVWWIRYSHRGQDFRESSKSARLVDAERLLKNRWKQIGKGKFIGPKEERVTVTMLLDRLALDYQNNGRRSSLSYVMGPLRAYFGTMRAVDVRGATIEQYKAQRLATRTRRKALVKPASLNRELAALRRAFKLGIKDEWISSAPVISLLAEHNARQGFVEPATFATIAAALPTPLDDLARFAYTVGWRVGEVKTLEWRDVDLTHSRVTLRWEESKNEESRVIILTGDLLPLMARRWAARTYETATGPALSPYVFHVRGRAIVDFRKRWRKACAAAGVPGLLFHDLRRSCVRNMDAAGVSAPVAMTITGHKTSSVYRRYRIVDEADIKLALDRTQAATKQAPGSNVKAIRT